MGLPSHGRAERTDFLVPAVLVLGLSAVYVISLLPPIRGDAGTLPLIDVWLNMLVDLGVMVVVALRGWSDRRRRGVDLTMAVNISASDLVDDSFSDHVVRRLAAYRIPPRALVIEITEGRILEDGPRAARTLERLRHSGVGIAVDDFGTGYSSLARLSELPVSELKLDRSFVQPMLKSPRAAAIVRSTVQLASALELDVVAEGVEDEATLAALRSIGCPQAQGFHIGRPTTPQDVAARFAHETLRIATGRLA